MSVTPAQALHDGLVLTKRSFLQFLRLPESLVFTLAQSAMFVFLFAYVFGGAIPVAGGGSYRELLMPGIFTQTVTFASIGVAVGMADDMNKGLIDRFRSLPISRSAVLAGRTTAELGRQGLVIVVMVGAGLLVGWRVHNGFLGFAAGILLLLAFAFAMSWLGALIGQMVGTAEAAQGAGFVILFPLTFLSNGFVPQDTLPPALQTFSEWNPISAMNSALRLLFGNPDPAPIDNAILRSIVWIGIILAVCVPLAVRRYLRTAR
jgi:ABC transporter DrrB family efflux protein